MPAITDSKHFYLLAECLARVDDILREGDLTGNAAALKRFHDADY